MVSFSSLIYLLVIVVADEGHNLRWPRCTRENVTSCTHRPLTYNLFISSNLGHLLFDDLLNLIWYKPETVCNVFAPAVLDILDYTPAKISSQPCEESDHFLYYGYYETQTEKFQKIKDRFRIASYTEFELRILWRFIDNSIAVRCPNARSQHKGILHIRREQRYGRYIPDEAVVPPGSNEMYVNSWVNGTMQYLCQVAAYDVVVVPWGSELALPVVLGIPFVALMNDWVDPFYYRAIISRATPFNLLYMNSKARNPRRYYNQFAPTANEIRTLTSILEEALVISKNDAWASGSKKIDISKSPSSESYADLVKQLQANSSQASGSKNFAYFPFSPPATGNHGGILGRVRQSRARYIQQHST